MVFINNDIYAQNYFSFDCDEEILFRAYFGVLIFRQHYKVLSEYRVIRF